MGLKLLSLADFLEALVSYRRTFEGTEASARLVAAFEAVYGSIDDDSPPTLRHAWHMVDRLKGVVAEAGDAKYKWELEKALERATLECAREISTWVHAPRKEESQVVIAEAS